MRLTRGAPAVEITAKPCAAYFSRVDAARC